MALSGSLAVGVGRVAGGVCGCQRWPWGWVSRKRGRLSGGLAGVCAPDGRQWPYRWPSVPAAGVYTNRVAVGGRRAGCVCGVLDRRACIYKSGGRRWSSAVAVSVGRRVGCVLMAIPFALGTRKRRKRRRAGRWAVVRWSFLGCSLMAFFAGCVTVWGGGWGRSREAAAAGGRQQPRSGGSSSREAAAGRWLGLGLQMAGVAGISRRRWGVGRARRQNGGSVGVAGLEQRKRTKKGGWGWVLYTFLFFGGWGLGAGSPENLCPLGGWGLGAWKP